MKLMDSKSFKWNMKTVASKTREEGM